MKKRRWIQRILHILAVLIGVSFLSFLLMDLAPGDPVRSLFAVSGTIPSEEALEEMREELGLNEPFLARYGNWVWDCLHGDFGTSYSEGQPVAQLLAARVMPTVWLALLALVLMLAMALPLGILSALHQNRPLDYLLRGGTFLGISMPNFWVGLLLLYVVAMKWKLVPAVSNQITFQRMLLPAFTLALSLIHI